MRLREAVSLLNRTPLSDDVHVNIVGSYEPLHFRTLLQGELIARLGSGSPRVRDFGFDQLESGLQLTETELSGERAVLLLDWADFHPSLSWRSRAGMGVPSAEEWTASSATVIRRLTDWFSQRPAGATTVVLPSPDWLPVNDSHAPPEIGPARARALAIGYVLAGVALAKGAKVLTAQGDVDFRSLATAACPLSVEEAQRLAVECVAALFPRPRAKVVVVDLDNTLWRGVLGEDGIDGIDGGPTGPGVPHDTFQRFLMKLRGEGVLLAYASKNDEEDVKSALSSASLRISLGDFAAGVANWRAKSEALVAIAQTLGVGTDSLVFIDDSAAELAEVSTNLPEVTALQTPSQLADWPGFLRSVQALVGTSQISAEDTIRTSASEADRRAHMASVTTPSGEFGHLGDMALRVAVNSDAATEPRSTALINKTNQFNLTGERIGELDLVNWSRASDFYCRSFTLSDRYGPYGTVAVLYGRVTESSEFVVTNFVVSCRALGRGIEYLILDEVRRETESSRMQMLLRRRPRNEPALAFAAAITPPGTVNPTVLEELSAVTVDLDTLSHMAARVRDEAGVQIGDD